MKIIKTTLFAILLTACANAATTIYTLNTGTTATSSGIANSAGLQFQNNSTVAFASAGPGVISFGYFDITDEQISAAALSSTLTSSFNNWNTSGVSRFNSPGPTQQRGVFSITAAARDIVTAGFAGENIYVFVGNATTYELSTEFLVLKTTFTFNDTEFGALPFTKTINTGNSSALIGTQVANVFTTGSDASQTPGWNTAVLVPEPSTSLLGALGALALLRRRRN